MRFKFFAIVCLLTSMFMFSACSSSRSTTESTKCKGTNFLGIINYQPESYAPTGPNTFAITTNELYTRRNFSGDRISLFWGFLEIKDY